MSVRQSSNNVLIMKDDIGKSKPATRNLPAEGHCYGKAVPRDPVGVQQRKSFETSWRLFSHIGLAL